MEHNEEIKQKTAEQHGIKLDSAFDALNNTTAKETPLAEASEQEVFKQTKAQPQPEKPKKKGVKIAVFGTTAIAAIGIGIASITTMLQPAPATVPAPAPTAEAAPPSPVPEVAPAPSIDAAPGSAETAMPTGIEIESIKGVEIQDDLYSAAELVGRANMVDQLASARPAENMTCESLAEDENTMFGKTGLQSARCNAIGASAYFACAPNGFSWDASIQGCELGSSAALALKNPSVSNGAPESLKAKFLGALGL